MRPHRAGSSRGSFNVTPVWLNRFGLASFEEQSRGVKGDAQSLGQTQDVEDEAVTRQELGVAVGYLEEDLDQELNPGTSQVTDGDLVLPLPHARPVPDQLEGSFTKRD